MTGNVNNINLLVCDIGGVVLPYMDQEIDDYIRTHLGLSKESFDNLWQIQTLPLIEGNIDTNKFWDNISRHTQSQTKLTDSLFLEKYIENFRVNTEVLEQLRCLKDSGIKVCVGSNSIKPLSSYNKYRKLYDYFDYVYLSEEIRISKPSIKFFEDILHNEKMPANQVIFVDDKIENVKAASSIGINGVQYLSNNQLAHDLSILI